MQTENEPTPVAVEAAASPRPVFMRPRRVQCQPSVNPTSAGVDPSPAGERSRSLALSRAVDRVLRYAKQLAATR
jgi:hypothetical protein